MNNKKYVVKNKTILFDFLRNTLNDKSKNNIKSLLSKNCILVNGLVETKYNFELKNGDVVTFNNLNININGYNIEIVYEDNNIIVVDKPSGILTVSTNKEKNLTIYHILMEYLKKKNKNNKIFVIHRLDKGTSGLLIFAKSEKIKKLYQENWNNIVLEKKYCAVVEGCPKSNKGTIKSYLVENSNYYVYSTNNKNLGKYSVTEYNVLKKGKKYSLIDINLKTGRKNQIRVHMKDIKCSIAGDDKYGAKTNPLKRLCLHSYYLKIKNPIGSNVFEFKSEIPKDFYKII